MMFVAVEDLTSFVSFLNLWAALYSPEEENTEDEERDNQDLETPTKARRARTEQLQP